MQAFAILLSYEGGVVASQLVKAGFNVIVLEKGGYYRQTDFENWRECEAMLHLYGDSPSKLKLAIHMITTYCR
jgi:choline dehydrogenase-like flavoprotein